MSHNYYNDQNGGYAKVIEVSEPEVLDVKLIAEPLQLERQIGKANLSVRKSKGVVRSRKGMRAKNVRRRRIMKIPDVVEKLVDSVNILRHEKFLQVANQFFKPSTQKQQRERLQAGNSRPTKNSDPASGIQMPDNITS